MTGAPLSKKLKSQLALANLQLTPQNAPYVDKVNQCIKNGQDIGHFLPEWVCSKCILRSASYINSQHNCS